MKKCKYAGDASDKNCKECNGISYVVADEVIPATECRGYEESTEDVDYKEHPIDPLKKDTLNYENIAEKTIDLENSTDAENKPAYTPADNSEHQNISFPDEISYMSGISVEKDSMWYKIEIGEKRKVNPNADESQLQEEKTKLYNIINKEVDDQVDDILKNN